MKEIYDEDIHLSDIKNSFQIQNDNFQKSVNKEGKKHFENFDDLEYLLALLIMQKT